MKKRSEKILPEAVLVPVHSTTGQSFERTFQLLDQNQTKHSFNGEGKIDARSFTKLRHPIPTRKVIKTQTINSKYRKCSSTERCSSYFAISLTKPNLSTNA